MELASEHKDSRKRGGFVSEEARTGKRFPLELPIKIHGAQDSAEHKGITGNLSAAGVYIRADANLDIGSNVEFEISLPPEVTGAKEPVTVHCKGRVVRSDEPAGGAKSGDTRGVACVIDSYDFVRKE